MKNTCFLTKRYFLLAVFYIQYRKNNLRCVVRFKKLKKNIRNIKMWLQITDKHFPFCFESRPDLVANNFATSNKDPLNAYFSWKTPVFAKRGIFCLLAVILRAEKLTYVASFGVKNKIKYPKYNICDWKLRTNVFRFALNYFGPRCQ